MKDTVRSWLRDGEGRIFLAYRSLHGHALPFAFSRDNLADIADMELFGPRYPLEKLALDLIAHSPGIQVGIPGDEVARRTVNVFSAWNQAPRESIRVFSNGQSPPGAPQPLQGDRKISGIRTDMDPRSSDETEPGDRFSSWMSEFQKCMKCYGCRNICPVCFCRECSLENQELIGTGTVLTEVPLFHLVRAVHMAGRCVDCGLCEAACPVGIPLRLLYRKVNAIVTDLFGYETGSSAEQPPLSILGDKVPLEPRPLV